MDDSRSLLLDTAGRLFAELRETPDDADAAWQRVAELGLPLALVDEAHGGFDLPVADALAVVRLAGQYALAAPLGEALLANRLLAEAGADIAEGRPTLAVADPHSPLTLNREGDRWRVHGRLPAAPWVEHAEVVVTIARHDRQNRLLLLDPDSLAATPGTNLADQPRTDLTLDLDLDNHRVRELPETLGAEWLFESGALLRCQEIAGALATVLDMTVQYASERVQFGKPLARQQAIQQQLAVLATQAAIAAGAADMAVDAFHDPRRHALIAAAKARCGEAAGQALAIAHQVHGAIGITREYRLNLYSRRLWSWRDEFGSERYWQARLGEQVLARGADGLWPFITELGGSTEGARQ